VLLLKSVGPGIPLIANDETIPREEKGGREGGRQEEVIEKRIIFYRPRKGRT